MLPKFKIAASMRIIWFSITLLFSIFFSCLQLSLKTVQLKIPIKMAVITIAYCYWSGLSSTFSEIVTGWNNHNIWRHIITINVIYGTHWSTVTTMSKYTSRDKSYRTFPQSRYALFQYWHIYISILLHHFIEHIYNIQSTNHYICLMCMPNCLCLSLGPRSWYLYLWRTKVW